uniref:Putative secreted protein n=1 Tax=Anopheles marajoara TaxID=58244 RepID=A0A2M4CFR6_9DIPT
MLRLPSICAFHSLLLAARQFSLVRKRSRKQPALLLVAIPIEEKASATREFLDNNQHQRLAERSLAF